MPLGARARGALALGLGIVVLGSLVIFIATLHAPLPGGGGGGGTSNSPAPTGTGQGSGGSGNGGQGGTFPTPTDMTPTTFEPCPTSTPTSTSVPRVSPTPAFFLPLAMIGPRRRTHACLALVLLAAVALPGCTQPSCRPVQDAGSGGSTSRGGGGGTGGSGSTGSGGGSGGGTGGGNGPGTGTGTAPDPPKIPPALLILLGVLAAAAVAAFLFFALARRRGGDTDAPERRLDSAAADVAADPRVELANLPQGPARDVVAAYVRAVQSLEHAGVVRARWETARELAARAPDATRAPLARLTRLYEAARHGGVASTDATVHDANALASEVAANLAAPQTAEVSAPG